MKNTTLCFLASLAMPILFGCGGKVEEIAPTDIGSIRRAPELVVAEGDWPWWRGPNRNNHAVGPAPPTSWSERENVLWKVSVPGRGHASPIVVGDRVFVTTADENAETQSILCYARHNGQKIWDRIVHNGGFESAHSKNSQASSTPACDGELVFTTFLNDDAIWVSAIDAISGEIAWQTKAGDFRSKHGYGSSPVLYKSLVIVSGDSSSKSFLAALDRKSSKLIWRVRRKNDHSFGTPIIGQVGGTTLLLLNGQDSVNAYDPASGKELWQADGASGSTAHSMAWSDDLIFSGAGYPKGNFTAHRADDGKVVWQQERFNVYVPSPLLVEDRLYCLKDERLLCCLDADTGELKWRARLPGEGNFSASPVLAGGLIFVPNEKGTMFIFKDGEKYEEVAANYLSEGGFASPVICDGKLFLRTSELLYCIGHPST